MSSDGTVEVDIDSLPLGVRHDLTSMPWPLTLEVFERTVAAAKNAARALLDTNFISVIVFVGSYLLACLFCCSIFERVESSPMRDERGKFECPFAVSTSNT